MIKLEDVLEKEFKAISAKREKCNSKDEFKDSLNLFGISLSGGGIRSATINLGILNILNKCGILPLADYLSTVSGGGYIGGYIHSKLRNNGSTKAAFNELFEDKDTERMKEYGYYLTPGKGIAELFNKFRFAAAFIFSLLMNWFWVLFIFFSIFFLVQFLVNSPCLISKSCWCTFGSVLVIAIAITIIFHFFLHGLRNFHLWSSDKLYFVETLLLILTIVYCLYKATTYYPTSSPGWFLLLSLLILILTGFFANPNLLTMHRFYRDRLAAAYLKTAGEGCNELTLSEINPGKNPEDWGCAPYPLINTCLNLSGKEDKNFKGTKTCDYFLLSPLYCGSPLVDYTETNGLGYKKMTLSTAVAISGAAIDPKMGTKTNRFIAFFMTLLNLRLGYWALNPNVKNLICTLSWWPKYHLMDLFCKADTTTGRLSITDGGHIENLGIYELLRRKCKLIIAIDASDDHKYSFSDLENLIIRARNELGIEIKFREGLDPETIIRPMPSTGFSISHFSIADIIRLPRENDKEEEHMGMIVYIKSSLRASKRYKEIMNSDSYLYKTYHPAFPHESTVDQFFDEVQWKAYYNLGRFIAGDLLQIDVTEEKNSYQTNRPMNTINELYDVFDKIKNRSDLEKHLDLKTSK
jgi:hypothetical protein